MPRNCHRGSPTKLPPQQRVEGLTGRLERLRVWRDVAGARLTFLRNAKSAHLVPPSPSFAKTISEAIRPGSLALAFAAVANAPIGACDPSRRIHQSDGPRRVRQRSSDRPKHFLHPQLPRPAWKQGLLTRWACARVDCGRAGRRGKPCLARSASASWPGGLSERAKSTVVFRLPAT